MVVLLCSQPDRPPAVWQIVELDRDHIVAAPAQPAQRAKPSSTVTVCAAHAREADRRRGHGSVGTGVVIRLGRRSDIVLKAA
jgi:hypothetical protein